MKAINSTILASGVAAALTGCSGLRLSDANALADDVYYDGSSAAKASTAAPVSTTVSPTEAEAYEKRVATYPGSGRQDTDNRDFSSIQQYYANANSTNGAAADTFYVPSTVKVTEVSAEYPDNGYWVGGFNGTEADQSYAERIVKFHRPLVTVNYYSPFFESARYSGDWNIYINGYGATYLVPTWSNPWYSDYYYGGLAYDWRWSRPGWYLNWGWGGWGFGWAGHWGYYDLAWGGWGWPYYHHHHHFAHCHGHWGHPVHHRPAPDHHFDRNRPVHASRASTVPQSYSGQVRQREMTTNPNAERAAQRYRQQIGTSSRVSRSYTRTVEGRPTNSSSRTSSSYGANSRRSDAASSSASLGEHRPSGAYQSNSRRSTSAVEGGTSRSSYTPVNRSSARVSRSGNSGGSSRGAVVYSPNARRSSSSSSSTYAPSSRQGSSSANVRRSSGVRQSSAPSTSTRVSRSSGASRSSSSFSGGSRSSGGSVRSSSGGGGSRGGRAR
ncbi:MAG: hypothetical protein II375_01850 [Bacteroidales bacterium]|nr:hypothetical protein [Bacteroidales bacterium]